MVAQAQTLRLSSIDAARAAAALAGIEQLDPTGINAAADVAEAARNGRCFELAGDAASAVYVLHVRNGVVWVDALAGHGSTDVAVLIGKLIEQQAAGFDAVAFQTARRGLVRKAQRQGFRVTGWILRKELKS